MIEIVAGPNGSGKTTFASVYLLGNQNRTVYLNPDKIASGIGPFDFEKASFQKNLQRIKKRVLLGGHPIPKDAVYRRHPRCFNNFWTLYRQLCSDWYVFENSGKKPQFIQSKTRFEKQKIFEQTHFMQSFLKESSND
jgi:predicted ABC-type ATPase